MTQEKLESFITDNIQPNDFDILVLTTLPEDLTIAQAKKIRDGLLNLRLFKASPKEFSKQYLEDYASMDIALFQIFLEFLLNEEIISPSNSEEEKYYIKEDMVENLGFVFKRYGTLEGNSE